MKILYPTTVIEVDTDLLLDSMTYSEMMSLKAAIDRRFPTPDTPASPYLKDVLNAGVLYNYKSVIWGINHRLFQTKPELITLYDISKFSAQDLLRCPKVGKHAVFVLDQLLRENGLKLAESDKFL